jgi:hypothetical protein
MSFACESDPPTEGVVSRRFVLRAPMVEPMAELERWAAGNSSRSCSVVDSGPETVTVELRWQRSDAACGRELSQLLPRFLVRDGELHAIPPAMSSS